MFGSGLPYPWKHDQRHGCSVAYAGHIDDAPAFFAAIDGWAERSTNFETAVQTLIKTQRSCFGLVVETQYYYLCVVDHVRSYPIFYCTHTSNPPILLNVTKADHTGGPRKQVLETTHELLLCGYVLANRTIYENVYSILPGEALLYKKSNHQTSHYRHFTYMPEFRASTELGFSESQLVNQLGTQINMAFQKIVRQAKGRPIWVPLSGGLDSRLIVSKLVEHGHDDLTTFSFGLKNNHEMVRARKVANTLGLKWIPAPSQVDRLSDLYLSPERRGYTDLAFNGQTTPVWLDFESVHWLVNSGRIPKDAIIINGYSGDFIFGGHIYNALLSSGTSRKIVDLLISKHCSHFKSKSLFGVTQQITDRILQQIDELLISGSDPAQLASFSEFWDWQERQVKAVVNGQRLYEFYGLDWRLPFWDRDLVEYCRTIPIDLRAEQKLHISYLKAYNFRGLFRDLRPSNQLWTPKWRWVPAIAKLIELTRGSKQKALFYEKMYFFGYHRFQLGLFGRQKYLQTHGSLRRPYVVPLATLAVLDELGLNYPTGLLVALDKKES